MTTTRQEGGGTYPDPISGGGVGDPTMWAIPWCIWCYLPSTPPPTSPPHNMNRHLWKHYLSQTSFAGGNYLLINVRSYNTVAVSDDTTVWTNDRVVGEGETCSSLRFVAIKFISNFRVCNSRETKQSDFVLLVLLIKSSRQQGNTWKQQHILVNN